MPPLPDIDAVLDLAVTEMYDRLSDHERRAAIPDHVLSKFLGEANKVADRRRAEKEQEEDERETDVLEIVKKVNLPAKRRQYLIQAELDRTRARERDLVAALTEGEFADG